MLFSLVWRWENPEQRDNEIYAQIRLEIGVRLTPTNRPYGGGPHIDVRRAFDVGSKRAYRLSQHESRRVRLIPDIRRGKQRMAMRGHLAYGQRDLFRPTGLRQNKPIAHVNGDPPSQIWQRECGLAVSTVGRANQVEKGFVLGYRK
jgi:hypothetical protein